MAVVAGHLAEGKLNKECNIHGEELDEEDEADEWKKAEEENEELDEEDPSPSASPSAAKDKGTPSRGPWRLSPTPRRAHVAKKINETRMET